MMLNPLVSILIPLYNAEKYLSETMESLLSQTYKNIEIIIVNDGSTDGSLALAKKYEYQFNNVKVYTQKNNGASSARNYAYSKSMGTYIQYFDADDIMHPQKIETQMQILKAYGYEKNIIASGKWVKFFNSRKNLIERNQIINKNYDDVLLFLKDSWTNIEAMIGQSWIIHRSLHEKVGQWNIMISVNDDGDFFTRIVYASDKIVYVEKSLVYWRQDNLGSLSKNTTYEGEKSQLLALETYDSIVQENIDYPGLKYALAVRYSIRLFTVYPHYKDLYQKIISKLNKLGYSKPIFRNRPKFSFMVNIFGFQLAMSVLNACQILCSRKN